MIKQRRQLKDTRISNSVKISRFTKFSFDRPLAAVAFKGLKLFSLIKSNKYDRSFRTLKLNYRNYEHKNIKYTYNKEKIYSSTWVFIKITNNKQKKHFDLSYWFKTS